MFRAMNRYMACLLALVAVLMQGQAEIDSRAGPDIDPVPLSFEVANGGAPPGISVQDLVQAEGLAALGLAWDFELNIPGVPSLPVAQLAPGQLMLIGATPLEAVTARCTSGFAINPPNEDGFVTAGHCGEAGDYVYFVTASLVLQAGQIVGSYGLPCTGCPFPIDWAEIRIQPVFRPLINSQPVLLPPAGIYCNPLVSLENTLYGRYLFVGTANYVPELHSGDTLYFPPAFSLTSGTLLMDTHAGERNANPGDSGSPIVRCDGGKFAPIGIVTSDDPNGTYTGGTQASLFPSISL